MATPTSLPASFSAGSVLTASQMNNLRGAFRVLQVVSTTVTAHTFTRSNTAYADITGLTATITPSATSSKVLCFATVSYGLSVSTEIVWLQFARGGTAIGGGDQGTVVTEARDTNRAYSSPMLFLDSPNTTAATTYSVQTKTTDLTYTFYLNRRGSTDTYNGISTLTLCEISA